MLEFLVGLALAANTDPYAAYQAQAYDQALQGFLDLQVQHPNDPALAMNVGSAYYQMKSYGEAEKAFSQALRADNPQLREQALYNMGNSAFQQGKLEEAIERYTGALQLDSHDPDARANLAFTQQELQRRREAAQHPQKPPQPSPADPNQQPQPGDKQPGDKQPGDKQPGDKPQPEHAGDTPQQAHSEQPGDKPGDKPQQAQQEQTQPADKQHQAGHQADKNGTPPPHAADGKLDPKAMTRQQAARYLDSITENRPKVRPPDNHPPQVRHGKDW